MKPGDTRVVRPRGTWIMADELIKLIQGCETPYIFIEDADEYTYIPVGARLEMWAEHDTPQIVLVIDMVKPGE